jgi:hypothetical protein
MADPTQSFDERNAAIKDFNSALENILGDRASVGSKKRMLKRLMKHAAIVPDEIRSVGIKRLGHYKPEDELAEHCAKALTELNQHTAAYTGAKSKSLPEPTPISKLVGDDAETKLAKEKTTVDMAWMPEKSPVEDQVNNHIQALLELLEACDDERTRLVLVAQFLFNLRRAAKPMLEKTLDDILRTRPPRDPAINRTLSSAANYVLNALNFAIQHPATGERCSTYSDRSIIRLNPKSDAAGTKAVRPDHPDHSEVAIKLLEGASTRQPVIESIIQEYQKHGSSKRHR